MRTFPSLPARLTCLFSVLALSGLAAPLRAELKEGDPAPALTIEKWIKGEAIDLAKAKGKQTVVVEFWATWCGPCVRGIPHITKMAERFGKKDVVFVGVSIDGEETREKVEPFVKDMGDKMGYTVALDKEGATQAAWLDAAGARGIPHAFVVGKDGTIVWQGHPMSGLGKKLAELVDDKAYIASEAMKEKAMEDLQKAFQDEEWPQVLKNLDVLIEVDPAETQLLHFKYHLLAVKLKEKEKARAWGETLIEKLDSAQELNNLSWSILTDQVFETVGRDSALALKAAKKAVSLPQGKTWSVLDTLALAHFQTGDAKEAVQTQKEAIALARKDMADDSVINQLEENLARFEKGPEADDAKDDDAKDDDAKDDDAKEPEEKP